MLIEKYDLEVFTPPYEPGVEQHTAIARLTTDISAVLPYLNATLRGAVYHRPMRSRGRRVGTISFFAPTKLVPAMSKISMRRSRRLKAWSS